MMRSKILRALFDGNGPLRAITCLFGDRNDGRRLAKYRAFREALPVPLVTVELTFGDLTQLNSDDAEVLVSLSGGEVMWQKERLLNLALAHLPPTCRYVAWIDSDVILRRDDWPLAACQLLDEFPVAQLFERVMECPRDVDPHDVTPVTAYASSLSFAWRWRHGRFFNQLRERKGNRIKRNCASGIAWAARRELLDAFGFYDACIAGAGDRAMIGAMIDRCDDAIHGLSMTEAFAEHYLRWAGPIYAQVEGRIGCLSGDAVHLCHGDPRLRDHTQRHRALNQSRFDPARDIVLKGDGTWRFNSDKPELHDFFRAYFERRKDQEMLNEN